jgi:hypothetical protein
MTILRPLAILCLVASPASADDLFRGPAPDWAERLPLPEMTEAVLTASATGPVRIIEDTQIAWQGGEVFTYTRSAVAAGETDPTVTFTYDPAFETVMLTHLELIRDGVVTDAVDTPATVQPVQTEAEGAVPTGAVVVTLTLPDLQPGEVLDYAVLRRRLPAFDGDGRGGSAMIEGAFPVVQSRLVLNWPADWPTYFSGWPARIAYAQAPADGIVRHEWTRLDYVPPATVDFTPPGWTQNLSVEWSADPGWAPIAAALSDHYAQTFPMGPWQDRIDGLLSDNRTDGERLIDVIGMVQDEIGTLDLPLHSNAYMARKPAEVIAAGAGDSKDKALLLRAMLDRLGIPATVALASTTDGASLNGRKPRVDLFDRAIVKVTVEGFDLWVDPTLPRQYSDIYSFVSADYGDVLPLDGPNREVLESIPASYATLASLTVNEDYAFNLVGLYLTFTSSATGTAADPLRRAVQGDGQAAEQARLFDLRRERFPGLRSIAPIEVYDDPTYNSISVTERYVLTAPDLYDSGILDGLSISAGDIAATLPTFIAPDRTAPVWLGETESVYYTVSISGAPGSLTPPEPVYLTTDAYSFSRDSWASDPGGMSISWTYTLNQSTLDASAALDVPLDAAMIARSTELTLDLSGPDQP